MIDTKTCTKCKETKPLTDFNRLTRSRDGRNARCQMCMRSAKRVRYPAIRDHINASNRKWESENPEKVRAWTNRWRRANRAKTRESYHRYYQENRDKILLVSRDARRKAYAANPEKYREKARKHRRLHPEYSRRYLAKRRANKKGAGWFTVTPKDLHRLMNNPCYICGAPSVHIDHVIPLSKGGRHSIGNLAPACQSCNQRKHAKFLIEFKAQIKAEAA